MKKTLITLVVLLLATFSASAQIFRSGGIGAYGTSTGYGGSKSRGGSSQGPQGWYIGVGGIYNKLASDDRDILDNFGGIGGMLEIGKGSSSVAIEVLSHSFDEEPNDDVNVLQADKVSHMNYRAYYKQRKHFGNLFYGYVGFGVVYYKTEYDFPADSEYIIEDEDEILIAGSAGLGLNFDLGGPVFFLETGFSIFNEPTAATITVGPAPVGGINTPTTGYTQEGTIQLDGIRGGLRFYL